MKIFKTTTIGEFHVNHNEDALISTEIGNDKVLVAIMDGCSMGKESHFISTLIGKILRKKAKEISYREFIKATQKELKDYLFEIIKDLFQELQFLKNRLILEEEETLSTIILGVINHSKGLAEVLVIGDGLICCNGTYFEYEQDNKPDYLGYHLEKDFYAWFSLQTQRLSLNNVVDFSISSDGIFTFKKYDNNKYLPTNEEELVHFLLINSEGKEHPNMLKKKVLKIENEFGLKPTDDLSIIRIITE